MQVDHVRIRALASWHREQAERAPSPVIWDARLRTAEDFDAEADRIAEKFRRRLLVNVPSRFRVRIASPDEGRLGARRFRKGVNGGQKRRLERFPIKCRSRRC